MFAPRVGWGRAFAVMALFWSIAALLVAATLGLLLWPLLRRSPHGDALDPDAAAIAVFRDQKRALDGEYAAGTISAEERDATLGEITRRVAEEAIHAPRTEKARPSLRAWVVALVLIAAVPGAAFLLYQRLGNPAATTVAAIGAGHEVSNEQIVAMVDALAQKLKQRPDDAEGWVLLARSYRALERFAESAEAYEHAETLVRDDPDLLADYADVLAMAQGKRLAGKPAALIERALAIDPGHKKALALAGTVALEAHDFAASLGYWRRLAAQLTPGSDEARQIADVIAEVESAQRGEKGSAPGAKRTQQAQAPAPATARSGTISGRVDLAPALASKVALNDTVFIYARASEGTRMPLALLRIPATELPKTFSLDDSMGMAPGVKLSAAPAVIVEARISKTGSAAPQPGDLFGRSTTTKPGTTGINITIDQVVQ
ncbi:MAG TPA: c-type cytochrome biogenesis protein CcmI [Casimicrobiaceae bacterium]|nr:c-type cytochrome biogenesis protein CcmI [Casimicrobiaceae bacterium]